MKMLEDNIKNNNENAFVVAFYKGTGFIATVYVCERKDATHMAKYYRSIGYNARILTYEQLEAVQNKESKMRMFNHVFIDEGY